jgi:thioesterase domain-containing protein
MTGISPVGAATANERSDFALVVIRAGARKPPLICVHGESGHLRLFSNLAQHLDPAQPVYGLRGTVHDGLPRTPYLTFEEMAQRYVRELGELEHLGPYVILGECNGAPLAYELAQQLAAGGGDVALLALVDSFGPGEPRLRVSDRAYRRVNSLRMMAFHLSALVRIDGRDRRAYVEARLRRILARLRTRASSRHGPVPEDVLRQRAYREAGDGYRPTPYAGRVALYRGASLPWGARTGRDLGWGRLVADLQITELSAYFGTCMLEPVVGRLATALERTLPPPTPPSANG